MDRKDDKWIKEMREKLDNYSPSYNAAAWSKLAGKLPATATGHGWLLSKIVPAVKVFIASTVVVVATIVAVHIYNNEESNNSEEEITNQTAKDTLTEPVINDINRAGDKNISPKTDEEFSTDERVSEKADSKESVVNITEDEQNDASVEEADSLQSFNSVMTDDSDEFDEIQLTNHQNTIHKRVQGTKHKSNYTKFSASNEENPDDPLTLKLKRKPIKLNAKRVKPNRHNLKHHFATSEVKPNSNQKPVERPFYIGVSYSGIYSDNDYWYPHNFISMFGLSMEKYLHNRISVSFEPKVSFNGIYAKHIVYIPTEDSLSGVLPFPVDSSDFYPGKLSFVELPLKVNFDIYTGKNYILAASVGTSCKYTFSFDKNSLPPELIIYNNKFTLFQSGIISVSYKRVLNDKMLFEVVPFWELPLKKTPEIFNRSIWGVSFKFKFQLF